MRDDNSEELEWKADWYHHAISLLPLIALPILGKRAVFCGVIGGFACGLIQWCFTQPFIPIIRYLFIAVVYVVSLVLIQTGVQAAIGAYLKTHEYVFYIAGAIVLLWWAVKLQRRMSRGED